MKLALKYANSGKLIAPVTAFTKSGDLKTLKVPVKLLARKIHIVYFTSY